MPEPEFSLGGEAGQRRERADSDAVSSIEGAGLSEDDEDLVLMIWRDLKWNSLTPGQGNDQTPTPSTKLPEEKWCKFSRTFL